MFFPYTRGYELPVQEPIWGRFRGLLEESPASGERKLLGIGGKVSSSEPEKVLTQSASEASSACGLPRRLRH